MYRTQSERAGGDRGRNHPSDGGAPPERRRKNRSLQLSSLGALVLDRIALQPDDLRSHPPVSVRRASETVDAVVHSEFLVCSGGLCVPTDGPLRLEEQLGVHYILGRSSWERCESAAHARVRLARRIDELDPHELASEAVALADTGVE